MRTDLSGVVLWQNFIGTAAVADSFSAVASFGGGFVLAGATSGPGPKGYGDGWLLRIDGLGNTLWSQTFGGNNVDNFYAAAIEGTGPIAFGTTTSSGDFAAWMVRTDAHGNTTCATSGTCAGLTATACLDTNPCTADLCSAAKVGCYRANLPDGSPCGSQLVCKVGICGP